jgi:hypothetical protein
MTNVFNQTIYSYRDWSQQPDLHYISMGMSIVTLVIFVINLWSASGHYQHMMEFAQLLWVLNYVEIEYPFALSSFFAGFRAAALGLKFSIGAPYIYSFSPSKYIRYNKDINLLRNCGFTIILGFVFGAIFVAIIIFVRVKK